MNRSLRPGENLTHQFLSLSLAAERVLQQTLRPGTLDHLRRQSKPEVMQERIPCSDSSLLGGLLQILASRCIE